ncbi:hypothetical protein JCM6882_006863 [Rhodosporidiobolus microsporus]
MATDNQRQRADVELLPLEDADLTAVAAGNILAFPGFYEALETDSSATDHATRVQRQATRLRKVLASPLVLGTKTVLSSGREKGTLVGIALSHRPGAPVVNLKSRLARLGEEETEEEKKAWDGVDTEKWNGQWGGWDRTRERIMGDVPHWYIAPLWILPEYQGQGIGGKLMQQILDLADAQTPTTPVYLEATAEGKAMYEKRGFVVEGGGEYVEMVRWNKDGRGRPE